MSFGRGTALIVAAALGCLFLCAATATAATPPTFHTVKISGQAGGGNPWSEPRIAVGPDGKYWAVTTADDDLGNAFVYSSADKGQNFARVPSPIAGQNAPTPDVDIVVLPSGRIIASELDTAGVNFPTSYSDDGGKTWTASVGATQLADQDRQWFAYGPMDKQTHQYPVYLLYHNLASGQAQHNMFVSTSTDSGATFGPPIPITLPGEDAYSDLQCADSGGPSTIFVNQNDGTIYAEFTTRASPTPAGDLGGCATAAAGQPFEFNIVAATRVWLAQSTDGGLTWTNSLAVDDASTGQIVSMQVAYAGLDTTGRIYVAYPESPKGKVYPDYGGAAVKYTFASAAKDGNLKWQAPRTIVPPDANAPGHVLVHMVVGQPGQLMGFYWTGTARTDKDPVWHMTAAQTNNGLDANPTITEARMSDIPTDVGTAQKLMGACVDAGPVSGVISGLACNRSPDVWGVALDPATCKPTVVWPAVDVTDNPNIATDDKTTAAGSNPGTFVSTQRGGPTLCATQAPGGRPTAGGTGGSCRDKTPPVTRFAHKRSISRRRLQFAGTSRDTGCKGANGVTAAGKVQRVYVSVARVRGKTKHQTCAFLTAQGSLTGFRNCRKPVLLAAKGSSSWSITLKPHGLPKGKYRVVVRAVDTSKNKERPNSGHNIEAFSVR
ncbi:MAG: repeat-like domain [Frankiaceae bacterium]|nr:repeat-like domain [Frankiaceae bacterium]